MSSAVPVLKVNPLWEKVFLFFSTMPVLLSSSKAIKRFVHGQRIENLGYGLCWLRSSMESRGKCGQLSQIRCLSSIARIAPPTIDELINREKEANHCLAMTMRNTIKSRWFLGCGDGEEGSDLSKNYKERRVIGYSPEQLFAVVAAVDLYEDFVPWCQKSRVIRRYADGSLDAELTHASESRLFEYLINIWEFNPGPVPGTCDLHFLVDFKFQSPLYRQVASMFFQEVVSRLVFSFTERCRKIYGPGTRVLENSYEQGS